MTVYHGTKKDRAVIRRYEWPTCRLEPTRQSCIINRQKAEEVREGILGVDSLETLGRSLRILFLEFTRSRGGIVFSGSVVIFWEFTVKCFLIR